MRKGVVRDGREAGDKRCPSSLTRFICACSRCRPSVVVKIYNSFGQIFIGSQLAITETRVGHAYIRKDDIGTVAAQEW